MVCVIKVVRANLFTTVNVYHYHFRALRNVRYTSLFSVIEFGLNLDLVMLYICKGLFAVASFSIHKNRRC